MPESVLQYSGIYGATNTTINIDITEGGVMSITSEQSSDNPAQIYEYSADDTFVIEFNSTLATIESRISTEEGSNSYEYSRQVDAKIQRPRYPE